MTYAIGIDLGATNIKALAVDTQGRVLADRSIPTEDGPDDRWAENTKRLVGALEGDLGARAAAALAAGCDVALHCNGEAEEMAAVAAATGPLSAAAQRRLAASAGRLGRPESLQQEALRAQLDDLLEGA